LPAPHPQGATLAWIQTTRQEGHATLSTQAESKWGALSNRNQARPGQMEELSEKKPKNKTIISNICFKPAFHG